MFCVPEEITVADEENMLDKMRIEAFYFARLRKNVFDKKLKHLNCIIKPIEGKIYATNITIRCDMDVCKPENIERISFLIGDKVIEFSRCL